jgi:hypothetical protein
MNSKHLEKIKKCFDLAKSGNPNEAANALAMAHKLMRKYGLSDEDIRFIEMGETTSKSKVQQKPVSYVNHLICSIADSFKVLPMLEAYRYDGAYPKFIGRKDSAMMAAYAFDVLYRQLKIARKSYLKSLHSRMLKQNKTIHADRYCEGWVHAVTANLSTEELPEEEKKLITDYQQHKLGPSGKAAKTTRRKGGSLSDYRNGIDDGQQINVNQPVNGKESPKLTAA